MFDRKTYRQRRLKLKKLVGSGIVLFPGHDESPVNYTANAYPFRQDSSFLYYFGLDTPGLSGLIDIDNDSEILFGDDTELADLIWTGPQDLLKDRAEAVGVKITAPSKDLAETVRMALRKRRKLHFLPPYRKETLLKLEQLTGTPSSKIKEAASLALTKAVIEQRSIKSDLEVSEIENALEITSPMYMAAMEMAKRGRFERDILGIMEGIMKSLGGTFSFAPIITVNGHVFHNTQYGNPLKKGRMIVADCGVESSLRYASDITRSIPVGGRFNKRQKDIYGIVLNAQMKAIAAMKPGVLFKDVHLATAKTLTKGLKALGLMKGNPEAAVAAGAHALFFPHGLGHQLGLDVHDMEGLGEDRVGYDDSVRRSKQFGLAYLRMARLLKPGHVMTIEPGIYFIPALIDSWKAVKKNEEFIDYAKLESFRDFGGIRIEDDVLITPSGHRVLGRPIPKTVEDVEAAAS